MSDLSLDPEKTALVAIDFQNAVLGRVAAPHPVAQVVQNNRSIADALRAKGGLVVWVHVDINRFLHLPVDQPSPMAGMQFPEEFSQIAPSAGKLDADTLITKPHWGAFAGTPLEQELRTRGIGTVILTGVATNIGVESTLRQGTGLGFAFVVAEDACSALNAPDHSYSFEKVFPQLARVRSTAEVIAALA